MGKENKKGGVGRGREGILIMHQHTEEQSSCPEDEKQMNVSGDDQQISFNGRSLGNGKKQKWADEIKSSSAGDLYKA